MKETITICDLCEEEITPDDDIFLIKKSERNMKQIGYDFVLTPRGNRLHTVDGGAMIRINAGFYCGVSDRKEMHFHPKCINQEVRKRVIQFFTGEE